MEYRKKSAQNTNDSACRHCVYAVKNYFTIGNRFILNSVSGCTKKQPNHKRETPFKELDNCLYFTKDRLSAIGGNMEQFMFFVSRQLEETNDLLVDIIDKLYPDEEIPDIPENEDTTDTDD